MMTKLNPSMQQPETAANQQQNGGMNAFMKYFFPAFSVFICLTSNAGFALYWVIVNVFATVQSIALNKYLEYKEKNEPSEKISVGKGSVK